MKNCAQCHSSFEVTKWDHHILDPLNIPEPTLCPQCRSIRRMTYRNDRTFYHAKSALSGKQMISMYPPGTPYKIYLQSEWYDRNKWDPLQYGRDFDFSRPFFEQFHELQLAVPRMNLDIINCENSDYCNFCGDDKDCYLDIAGEGNEDCYYNLFVKYSKDLMDCTFVYNSNHCYECINCYLCYNLYFGQYCTNTSDSMFVYDLVGCKNCLFSYNLRDKEYHIFNEPHTKEEYEKKRAEIFNGSHRTLAKALEIWNKHLKEKAIFRGSHQVASENCIGNDIKNCKNVQFGFNAGDCEDCKYLYDVLEAKDCMDLNYSLYKPELSVELISTLNMTHSAFSMASHYCHEAFYCDQSNYSKHSFGSNGLWHHEYCILNKQYSKNDYEQLKARIVEHMKKTGEWGQFFPANLSPFGYNETVAHEYFYLDKEVALVQGFKWADEMDVDKYKGPEYKIPDNIAETMDALSKQVLICEGSDKPYKVIPQELRFYRDHHLPVPHRSPQQRHLNRLSCRTPRRLWDRSCSKCGALIQSSYAPTRSEKVYCETCYLKEVY
ncbi:MAG: hypothetical protein V1908_01650 [Candidatus Peregrinibacteria bacterium]